MAVYIELKVYSTELGTLSQYPGASEAMALEGVYCHQFNNPSQFLTIF